MGQVERRGGHAGIDRGASQPAGRSRRPRDDNEMEGWGQEDRRARRVGRRDIDRHLGRKNPTTRLVRAGIGTLVRTRRLGRLVSGTVTTGMGLFGRSTLGWNTGRVIRTGNNAAIARANACGHQHQDGQHEVDEAVRHVSRTQSRSEEWKASL